MQSTIGYFEYLDEEKYLNSLNRAVATCVWFYSKGKVDTEEVYNYITNTDLGSDIKKIYNETMKHFGVKKKCRYKSSATLNEIKKIIDTKIPIIYKESIIISGYKEVGPETKIRIGNKDTYITYEKGSICY